MALPLKLKSQQSARMTSLKVLKRFEFESQLLRSGVLVADSAGSSDEAIFFVRGAPSCIEQLLGKDQVPADYHQVCCSHSFANRGHGNSRMWGFIKCYCVLQMLQESLHTFLVSP